VTDYLQRLQAAIKHMHGCVAEHVATTPIIETFNGKTIWQRDVERYSVRNHPRAKRCFAWVCRDEDGKDYYTAVLETRAIDSELAAVRAALVAQVKDERKKA